MIRVYTTINDQLQETTEIRTTKNPWFHLENPTSFEIDQIMAVTGVHSDFLRAALDEEEQPRLDFEEGQGLIIINVPLKRNGLRFDTIPLAIIVTETFLITVCLERTEALDSIFASRPRTLHTGKRTRLVLQLFYAIATQYLKYLRQIERQKRCDRDGLAPFHAQQGTRRPAALSKGLIYFTTSLRSNQAMMEKTARSPLRKNPADTDIAPVIRMYPEDEDLLEDVITENRQAVEMGDVYSNTLSGLMDAFAR